MIFCVFRLQCAERLMMYLLQLGDGVAFNPTVKRLVRD